MNITKVGGSVCPSLFALRTCSAKRLGALLGWVPRLLPGLLAAGVLAACSSSSSGSGGSAVSGPTVHCVEYNAKNEVVACLGFSNLNSTASSSTDMACLNDAGGAGVAGGHGVLASSCPSGSSGCCYTQQSTSQGEVGDFQCYYGSLSMSELQSICSGANSSIGGTSYTASPPF